MDFSTVFARLVAGIGATAVMVRRMRGTPDTQAIGTAPAIPAAKPQGAIPTLKMPTARGWSAGQTPVAAPGLRVNAFATGLRHPRWLGVLPNGWFSPSMNVSRVSAAPSPSVSRSRVMRLALSPTAAARRIVLTIA